MSSQVTNVIAFNYAYALDLLKLEKKIISLLFSFITYI